MPQTTPTTQTNTQKTQLNAMTTAEVINDSVRVKRQAGNLTQQLFLTPEEITQIQSLLTTNATTQTQLNAMTTATQVNNSVQLKRRDGNLVTTLYMNKNEIDVLSTLCNTHNTT